MGEYVIVVPFGVFALCCALVIWAITPPPRDRHDDDWSSEADRFD